MYFFATRTTSFWLLASESLGTANSETDKARPAARQAATATNDNRRIIPPPGYANRFLVHYTRIPIQLHPKSEKIFTIRRRSIEMEGKTRLGGAPFGAPP